MVLAFDPAEQQYKLDQARSELEEAEQELVKLDADTKVQAADDQVALLHARYEVRRAELEVSGNEFVGAIEARKNELALEEAKRALAQIEADVQTHADSNRAGRAGARGEAEQGAGRDAVRRSARSRAWSSRRRFAGSSS